jgi:hypothetical protein
VGGDCLDCKGNGQIVTGVAYRLCVQVYVRRNYLETDSSVRKPDGDQPCNMGIAWLRNSQHNAAC